MSLTNFGAFMKINLCLLFATLFLAQVAIAAPIEIKNGEYVGSSDDGKICNLSVGSDYGLKIGLYWKGAFGDGVRFSVKKTSQTNNILKVSGSADFASAKAKITLNNDGTPVEALMGVGAFMQLGYDINCKHLIEKQ
jgi:hypothetical protein